MRKLVENSCRLRVIAICQNKLKLTVDSTDCAVITEGAAGNLGLQWGYKFQL